MISPITLREISEDHGGTLPELGMIDDEGQLKLCKEAMRAGPNLDGVIYLFENFCFDVLFDDRLPPAEALRLFRNDVFNAFESELIDVIDNYNEAEGYPND